VTAVGVKADPKANQPPPSPIADFIPQALSLLDELALFYLLSQWHPPPYTG
jgi:hypothetical protein